MKSMIALYDERPCEGETEWLPPNGLDPLDAAAAAAAEISSTRRDTPQYRGHDIVEELW
jgi:hypothetical protein